MIHILTLTYNGLSKLQKLRPGLLKNLETLGEEFKWYIKSNGCKDGTIEEVSKWPEVKLLDTGHNRDNFAAGVNKLCSISNAKQDDIYLFLNNDVEFVDNVSIKNMFELTKSPNAGVVGSRLLYNNTNMLQHAGTIFSYKYGSLAYHFRHKEQSDKNAEKNRYFQCVTAACCMVKVGDLNKIGGMDENYHWSFCDVDMNLSIRALGKRNIYCGQTKIYHEESATLNKLKQNQLFLQHNVSHFKTKWSGKYQIDHQLYLDDPNYNVIV